MNAVIRVGDYDLIVDGVTLGSHRFSLPMNGLEAAGQSCPCIGISIAALTCCCSQVSQLPASAEREGSLGVSITWAVPESAPALNQGLEGPQGPKGWGRAPCLIAVLSTWTEVPIACGPQCRSITMEFTDGHKGHLARRGSVWDS